VLAKLTPEESGTAHRTETTQQVNVGDISGDNNTFNIYQHQGLSGDELARLIRAAVPDAIVDSLLQGILNLTTEEDNQEVVCADQQTSHIVDHDIPAKKLAFTLMWQ
jgi:hypothetical protein